MGRHTDTPVTERPTGREPGGPRRWIVASTTVGVSLLIAGVTVGVAQTFTPPPKSLTSDTALANAAYYPGNTHATKKVRTTKPATASPTTTSPSSTSPTATSPTATSPTATSPSTTAGTQSNKRKRELEALRRHRHHHWWWPTASPSASPSSAPAAAPSSTAPAAPSSTAPSAPTSSAPAVPSSSAPTSPWWSSAPAAPSSSAPASSAPASSAPAVPTSAPAAPTSSAPAAPTSSAPTSSAPAAPTSAPASGTFAQQVVDLTNAERAKVGCSALAVNPTLTSVALAHSQDMATNAYFAHDDKSGKSPFDRMTAAGYTFSTAGENIAAGQKTPSAVVTAWMNSTGHRENILNCAFTQIGVGYMAGGSYGHYWTQDFGTPR